MVSNNINCYKYNIKRKKRLDNISIQCLLSSKFYRSNFEGKKKTLLYKVLNTLMVP